MRKERKREKKEKKKKKHRREDENYDRQWDYKHAKKTEESATDRQTRPKRDQPSVSPDKKVTLESSKLGAKYQSFLDKI